MRFTTRECPRPTPIFVIHGILVFLLAAAGLLQSVLQLDAERLHYPACLAVTATFSWILISWYWLRRTLFEPYPLFMLAAALFNAGQAFLEVLGWNANGMLGGRVAPEILTTALYQVAISVALMHAGALVAYANRGRRDEAEPDEARRRASRMAGWCLLGVSIVPTVILFRGSFSLVMDHGYMSLFRNFNTLSTALALSAFLVPGIIFLLAGSARSTGVQLFCLAVTVAYAGMYLFLGARGSAAMTCVAVVWVFDRAIRPIPRTLIAVLALVAMIVFPLVRETRATSGRYRMTLEDQLQTLSNLENPVSSSVSEMGHSLVTVTHTLSLVPEVRPYDNGASYFFALAAIIPNLGWAVHPSIQHGLLSEWLVKTVDPVIAAAGGGLGFSFIAEAYLNFGWFGGPLWLGAVGFGLCWLFLKADGADPARHALAASFLAFFFVFARGEAAIVARGLVWYALLPYLLAVILTTRKRLRQSRRGIVR
jgi:oligosaccharide repeat unit polymerase